MIAFTFELPDDFCTKTGRGPIILVLIMESDNIDRMKQADPFDIHLSGYFREVARNYPIRNLDIVLAYEEDIGKIIKFREQNDLFGMMKWLERGRTIVPGDAAPPVPLRRT